MDEWTRPDPIGAGPDGPDVIFPLLGVARTVLRPRYVLVHGLIRVLVSLAEAWTDVQASPPMLY